MRASLLSALLAPDLIPLYASARDSNEVVTADRQNPVINAAVRKAQAGLEDFLALAAAPPAGTREFKVQVMAEDSHGIETLDSQLPPAGPRLPR